MRVLKMGTIESNAFKVNIIIITMEFVYKSKLSLHKMIYAHIRSVDVDIFHMHTINRE